MTHRILHAFQRLVLTATFFVMPKAHSRKLKDEGPEPLRRCVKDIAPARKADDLWLFGEQEADGVAHRMDMLAKDMSRLSGSLGGLRSLLTDVASIAPVIAADEAIPANAVYLADDALFDGESLTEVPMAVSAADEAGFLFEEEDMAETLVPARPFEEARIQLPLPEHRRAA